MNNRIPEWVSRYISIPYDAMNCWQLVMKVYAAEFGIGIGDKDQQSDYLRDRNWVDVIQEGLGGLEGDVILFRMDKRVKHVGLLLDSENMLHTLEGCNSCIERWHSPIWESRLVGIYRHSKRCTRINN